MYNPEDTICAVSTPPGTGAIAIIRCCGNKAVPIAQKIVELAGKKMLEDQPANTIHLARIVKGNEVVDQAMVSIFRAPHSYAGEDTIEISCHGSTYIQQRIVDLLVESGARPAAAGEFTLRAFLNGKIDLTQVEAIADLISSRSKAAHNIAIQQMRGGFTRKLQELRKNLLGFVTLLELELDFSEEDVEFADKEHMKSLVLQMIESLERLNRSFTLGNALKNGIPVAIAGKTNAGKSTLLNLLLSEEKAIVSEMEGTTRDAIEDVILIKGIPFRIIDTAGLRHTHDAIEKKGIERTWQKISQASIIVHVVEAGSQVSDIHAFHRETLQVAGKDVSIVVVWNKVDRLSATQMEKELLLLRQELDDNQPVIPFSAKTGMNLNLLEEALVRCIQPDTGNENDFLITNARHVEAIARTLEALNRALEGLSNNIPGDLLAQDIREAIEYLGEITGEITNDEILGNIFRNFCIGK